MNAPDEWRQAQAAIPPASLRRCESLGEVTEIFDPVAQIAILPRRIDRDIVAWLDAAARGRRTGQRFSHYSIRRRPAGARPVADSAGTGLLLAPFAAGLVVLATHVPLGITVLRRGIIFIDLAVAQVAALGVIVAGLAHLDEWWGGFGTQLAAGIAALGAAALLTFCERRWPEIQEALIGLLFVFAAAAGILCWPATRTAASICATSWPARSSGSAGARSASSPHCPPPCWRAGRGSRVAAAAKALRSTRCLPSPSPPRYNWWACCWCLPA
jgi:hypothetical protein